MSRKGSSQTESPPTTMALTTTSLQKRESNVSESSVVSNTPLTNTYQTTEVSNRNLGIRKRVNFKLNNVQADIVEEDEDETVKPQEQQQQQVALRKVYRKKSKRKRCGVESSIRKYNSLDRRLNLKNIVFNGTFPIDYPLKSRFESHSSSSGLDYSDEYEAIENCDHEYVDNDEGRVGESRALHSMSIQELVEDKKFNIAKMKQEFQVSLAEFEKFLAKGGPTHNKNVRTYSIDEPL